MASLMDALRGKLAQPTEMTGGQEAAKRLIRAKSGKAGLAPTGPAASNLGEQAAAAQAQQQLGQVQQQAGMAADKLAEQTAGVESRAQQQATELQVDKEQAAISQEVHNRAMADKQYLHNLELHGNELLTKNGILDNESFTRQMLGAQTDLLEKTLGYDMIYGKSQIDWQVAEQKLAEQWGTAIEDMMRSGDAAAAQWGALATVVGAGAQYAGASKSDKTWEGR